MVSKETLIAQALAAHDAAGPPPKSFGEAGEWCKRLDMSPKQHLVFAIYATARDSEILPGGTGELNRVVRTAQGASIPKSEIEAAVEAAETDPTQ